MPPIGASPFPDLAAALAAILADPAGIVSLTVCRSYPHGKIVVLGADADLNRLLFGLTRDSNSESG